MINFSKKITKSQFFQSFITITFIVTAFFLTAFAWYKGQTLEEFANHKANQANLLKISASNLFYEIDALFGDLTFLANNIEYNFINEVKSPQDMDEFINEIEVLFSKFADSQQNQYRIRYLDNSG
ncbi:hypothetical protein CYQ88_07120 [Hydrogenovibrio sp. SC-1]|uniref:hypothetical protein n=1 Tax=Hydrogenovibrio sp. SC-1 TaxID=2065820 RepID=UPI000C7D465E|nr:hypothetical protein [Hydrogenovibrio sp. SC-1]PLA74281.1 hypothetical protein CYQ88_07120 [Hydrogenovibrio sp. SC-1]